MKQFWQSFNFFKKPIIFYPLILSLIFLLLMAGCLFFLPKEKGSYTIFYKSLSGMIVSGSKGNLSLFWLLGWFIFFFHFLIFFLLYSKIKVLSYLVLFATPILEFFLFLMIYHLFLMNQ